MRNNHSPPGQLSPEQPDQETGSSSVPPPSLMRPQILASQSRTAEQFPEHDGAQSRCVSTKISSPSCRWLKTTTSAIRQAVCGAFLVISSCFLWVCRHLLFWLLIIGPSLYFAWRTAETGLGVICETLVGLLLANHLEFQYICSVEAKKPTKSPTNQTSPTSGNDPLQINSTIDLGVESSALHLLVSQLSSAEIDATNLASHIEGVHTLIYAVDFKRTLVDLSHNMEILREDIQDFTISESVFFQVLVARINHPANDIIHLSESWRGSLFRKPFTTLLHLPFCSYVATTKTGKSCVLLKTSSN